MHFHNKGRYWRRRHCVSVVFEDDPKPCVWRDVDVLTPRGPAHVEVIPAPQVGSLRFHAVIYIFFTDHVEKHTDAQSLQPDGLQGHDETVWNCDDHSTPCVVVGHVARLQVAGIYGQAAAEGMQVQCTFA